MRLHILVEPGCKGGVAAIGLGTVIGLECGRREESGDPLELRRRRIDAERLHSHEFLRDLPAIFVGAELVDEDLDPRLVDIVAPAVAIIDAKARLQIAQQIVGGHKAVDLGRDHRRAAHAPADKNARAEPAVLPHQLDADIVQPHRRAILVRRDHRDLELARQIAEFGVEARPLPQQLRPGARIGDFIGGGAGILIRADVADAIAAGLDRVHLDAGEIGEDIGRIGQLDPVILEILARGEMAVIAIIFARDVREHPHLRARQRAIGNGDAQHIGVKLEIEPVHQPERLELVLAHRPRKAAGDLIAKFVHPGIDDRLVICVILVHWSPALLNEGEGIVAHDRAEIGKTLPVDPHFAVRGADFAEGLCHARRIMALRGGIADGDDHVPIGVAVIGAFQERIAGEQPLFDADLVHREPVALDIGDQRRPLARRGAKIGLGDVAGRRERGIRRARCGTLCRNGTARQSEREQQAAHHITQAPASGSAGFSVRSGRTVGPSARTRSLIWAGRGPSGAAVASIT